VKFRLNDGFTIDSDEEPWRRAGIRIGIYAEPGWGKSYLAAAAFIEPFLDQGGTVVIFEPRQESHTLKSLYPDVLMVGGPHIQDIPFTASHPALYADAVVDSGISLVFYTADAPSIDRLVEFVSGFLKHLMRGLEKRKRPVLVVLEEANRYCPLSTKNHPEGAAPWVLGRMIGTVIEMFRDARKLGIVPVVISQRPQDLNFAVRQLSNLSLFGGFSIQDAGYLDREVLAPMRKDVGVEVEAMDLAGLKAGEWIAVTRGQAAKQRLTVVRKTPHGAETPELAYIPRASETVRQKAGELAGKLEELLKKEEQEAGELEKARRRVKELEEKLAEAEERAKIKLSVKEMLEGEAGGGDRREGSDELEEKLTQVMGDNDRLLQELKQAREENEKLAAKVAGLQRDQERLKALDQLRALLMGGTTDKPVEVDYNRIVDEVLKRLPAARIPAPEKVEAEVEVKVEEPTIELNVERPTLEADERTLRGTITLSIHDGFFDQRRSLPQIKKRLLDMGMEVEDRELEKELMQFLRWRLLERTMTDRHWYRASAGAKERISIQSLK